MDKDIEDDNLFELHNDSYWGEPVDISGIMKEMNLASSYSKDQGSIANSKDAVSNMAIGGDESFSLTMDKPKTGEHTEVLDQSEDPLPPVVTINQGIR